MPSATNSQYLKVLLLSGISLYLHGIHGVCEASRAPCHGWPLRVMEKHRAPAQWCCAFQLSVLTLQALLRLQACQALCLLTADVKHMGALHNFAKQGS